MKPTAPSPEVLSETLNQAVAALDAKLQAFIASGDPANVRAVRRAAKRLKTPFSLLPRRERRDRRLRRYMGAARKLARAMGEVRDLDTILDWATNVSDQEARLALCSDIEKQRAAVLRKASGASEPFAGLQPPSIDGSMIAARKMERRVRKVEKKLAGRLDREFEEFLSTQEVEVMHALRKDSKRLRHLHELTRDGGGLPSPARLRSIQDDLGAIRDHDLVIDYLRGRTGVTGAPSLVREEIARRHRRLEEFVAQNRGLGRLVASAE